MNGMALSYGPGSAGMIIPHVKWHQRVGVGLLEATLHNPDDTTLLEMQKAVCDFRSLRYVVHYTAGPITLDQQVVWTNAAIDRLISRGAKFIMTADDDEYYARIDTSYPIVYISGYCYYETLSDPGSEYRIPAACMTWRDNGVGYQFAKVAFTSHMWTGSMLPGNHWMRGQSPCCRINNIIHHFTYRRKKPMFSHRQNVVAFEPLTDQEIVDRRLVRDTFVRDNLWL